MTRNLLPLVALLGLLGTSACRSDRSSSDSAVRSAGDSAAPGSTAIDTLNAAWWVSWRVPPSDSVIEGIPVRALDASWTRATALSSVTPPPGALDTAGTFRMLGARFASDGDFNRDDRPDRALVGTYRAEDGEEGRFIAILTRNQSGGWEKAAVFSMPGVAGFSALIDGPRGNEPTWIECMECDTSADIRWRNGQYDIIVHSCCDDEPSPDSGAVARPPEE